MAAEKAGASTMREDTAGIIGEPRSSSGSAARSERSQSSELSPPPPSPPSQPSITRKREQDTVLDESKDEDSWSKREILELLKIQRDHDDWSKEEKAKKLHAEMLKTPELVKPMRSGYEVFAKIRELAFVNTTVERARAEYDLERNPPKEPKEPVTRKPRPKKKAKAGRYWPVKAILAETGGDYLISWKEDEETGETFQDSWIPHEYANKSLIDSWEEQKRAKNSKGKEQG